jgi:hypothetical protein
MRPGHEGLRWAKIAGVRSVTLKWGMGVAGQPAEGVETGVGSRFFPGSPPRTGGDETANVITIA